MAFEHLAFKYRWIARVSKIASDLLLCWIPKFRTWKQTQRAMELNHWLMSHYGYWERRPDGATEFKEL